jgi:hypothetical protein
MVISTISAPNCVRHFSSDDSCAAVKGNGFGDHTRQSTMHIIGTSRLLDTDMLIAHFAKFECDFRMKGGMNSVS